MILRADARRLPLPDASVDLIVTSPPYYALRSYTDGGQHYDGQIGAEPTPAEYVDNLIACTREWMRVLKPSGSIWLNLGDKYAGSPSGPRSLEGGRKTNTNWDGPRLRATMDTPSKSLMGLPWRYALRCIDELGLILRAEVIWSKPNGLPESVTDRVRRSHEQWFHLVRSPRYYSAVDTIRQPHSPHTTRYYGPGTTAAQRPANAKGNEVNGTKNQLTSVGALGALPGSVWEIATQPLKVPAHLDVDHFAAFPMEWPRRIIQGWSPSGVCTGCGEGRRPLADRSEKLLHRPSGAARVGSGMAAASHSARERSNCGNVRTAHRIVGEVCACPDAAASTRPGVVLDPFGGTGTTALVAAVLGRVGISVDMSADYCRLAQWRTTDPGQIATAMQVDKPPVQLDDQGDLLDLLGLP